MDKQYLYTFVAAFIVALGFILYAGLRAQYCMTVFHGYPTC